MHRFECIWRVVLGQNSVVFGQNSVVFGRGAELTASHLTPSAEEEKKEEKKHEKSWSSKSIFYCIFGVSVRLDFFEKKV